MNANATRARSPRRPRRACRPAALALALLGAGGCVVEESSPQSLIEGPRILAISASPPVAGLSESATLTAAVVLADGSDALAQPDSEPDSETDIAIEWRVCSPWQPVLDLQTDCGPESSIAGADLPPASEPAALRLPVAELLGAFPPPPDLPDGGDGGDGQMDPDTGDCRFDYAYIEVPVVLEATVGTTQLAAIKRVRVAPSQDAGQRGNPRIAALLLDEATVTDGQAATFAPGQEHRLSASLDPASLDLVCDGAVEVREPVRVHVYVTAGEVSDPHFDLTDPADTGSYSPPEVVWTAPETGAVTLWLVAVDSDGGVGWARFPLQPS